METNIQKKKFNFWNDHSIHYLEMAYRTEKRERLEKPDGYGRSTGDCGDTVEIFMILKGEQIKAVSFDTDGCLNTAACANTVIKLAESGTIDQAWEIKVDDVVEYLETLPSNAIHCAELSVGALYLALSNARKKR